MFDPVTIVTVLGVLLKKAFEKGVEKAGEEGAAALVEGFKKRIGHSSARPEAAGIEGELADLAANPDDTDTQAALRRSLRKATAADPGLAAQLAEWLAQAQPESRRGGGTHQVANASGGAVVAQVSGSNNTVNVQK